MKKVQIEIDDETHAELLKKQLTVTLANGGRKVSIAKLIADILREQLVKEKASK